MSLRCGGARELIGRPGLSEAERLELEVHLEACEACRGERARWAVIGEFAGYSPSLTAAARERVRERFFAEAGRAGEAGEQKIPSRRWAAMAAIATLAAAAAVALALGLARREPPRVRVLDGDVAWRAVGEGARIEAKQGGEVSLDGARVALAAATSVGWSAPLRTVTLDAGEVTVDVTPGAARPFHVATRSFVVEVLGTRFAVSPSGVRTERGKVRVLALDGRELARVAAGEAWTAAPPTPAPTAPAPTPPTVSATATVDARPAALLDRARSALAHGDAARARALVAQSLAARPTLAEQAEGRVLLADAAKGEGQHTEAIRAYLAVAHDYPRLPQGESALFAAAQLALEEGRRDEARRGFADYLARYPHGRFVTEARAGRARLAP